MNNSHRTRIPMNSGVTDEETNGYSLPGRRQKLVKSLLIRWFIEGMALWVTVQLVPGIHAINNVIKFAIVIALFCVVNAIFRPILWLLTCPLILVIVGPLMLVLNAITLLLSSRLAGYLGLGFTVEGFVPALLGAVVISVLRVIATKLVLNQKKKKAFRGEQARIGQLEQYKKRLLEQRDYWQQLARNREQIIQEQQTSIGLLNRGKDG